MKIKNLVKLGICTITATILLSGCGASKTLEGPKFNPIQINKSSNLSINEKKKLLELITTELPKGYEVSMKQVDVVNQNGKFSKKFPSYQIVTNSNGKGFHWANVNITFSHKFELEGNEIVLKDYSNCLEKDCNTYSTEKNKTELEMFGYINFLGYMEEYISKNYPVYLEEYPKYKAEINNWIRSIDDYRPNFSFISDISLDKKVTNEIAKDIIITKATIKPEGIYHLFKIEGGKKDLKTYLRENMCMFNTNSAGELNYKRFKLNLETYNKVNYSARCITESKLKKDISLIVDNVSFNYLKDNYTSSNKDIIIELERTGYKTYNVKVSNKTSKFIQMKTLSLYYGGDIVSIDLNNIKLAPNSSTLKGKIQLSLLDNMDKFVKVTSINQKIDFGIAGEYTINGQFKNIYDVNPLTINSFN